MNAPLPPDAISVARLPIAHIVESLSNPRKHFDPAYIAELAESIKSHGLIQPITVRPNPKHRAGTPIYEIVVGACRWRAAKLAGLADIPAFWRELDDKQVLEIQVIENLQRRDVHPIEEAEGYGMLIQVHGYRAEEIAAKIGKSRAYVYARMKLTALCPVAREACYEGKLDASTALLIARIPGEVLQKKATKEVVNGYNGEPLSYRAAKQHIQSRYTLSLKQANFSPEDATLLPAAGACSACPKYSANERDLFTDIESLDVCTDPDCFEAKRLARREQLIAHAEKRKIPVITGDAARSAWHNGDYVNLDAEVDDDAQARTYREILGERAIVTAMIERPFGANDLAEFGQVDALDAALKKAGWEPARDKDGHSIAGLTPEQIAAGGRDRAEREKHNAEREAAQTRCEALVDIENAWRKKLHAAVWPLLATADLDVSRQAEIILHALAAAWMRMQVEYSGFEEDALKTFLGIELPEEYDDDVELEKILRKMAATPLGTLLAMMLDSFAADHRELRWHQIEDGEPAPRPHTLLALATAFNIDAEALRDPPVTEPKPAKKPAAKKTKATPNLPPATPPNPPALNPAQAWPFPTPSHP